jgi:Tol biopolymer transport system component
MRTVRLVLSIGVLSSLASCDQVDSSTPQGAVQAPLAAPAAATPPAVPRGLDDVRTAAGGTADAFFVTPRWSPSSDRLLLSGYRGVGLHVLTLADSSLRQLDADCRGAARWAPDGRRVMYPVLHAQDAFVELDPATGGARNVPRPSFVPAPIERFSGSASAELLWDADGVRVLFEEYEGRLVVEAEGRRTVLADEDAWGPRPSPDGRHVAWCTGHLLAAQLHVAATDGSVVFADSGAHPAWLPDGSGLVFSVPFGSLAATGSPRLAGADLWIVDLRDGSRTQLTDTAADVEMEPAVSPDGAQLAWAEWNTGAIRIGRLVAGPGAGNGGGR